MACDRCGTRTTRQKYCQTCAILIRTENDDDVDDIHVFYECPQCEKERSSAPETVCWLCRSDEHHQGDAGPELTPDGGQVESKQGTEQATGAIIRRPGSGQTDWHHSVEFDGYEHATACGETVDCDDIQQVKMDLAEWANFAPRECCDECGASIRSIVEDWDGLHAKYEVFEDGERVENCFVLEPETDSAARAALIEYAEETNNEDLAQDLRDWVVDICTRGEQHA
jgi:hypothetical protein